MSDPPKVGATNAGRSDPRSAIRRRDRGKDDAWVAAFLHRASYGFLATVGDGGQPFLNSNLFVFDDDAGDRRIYLHTHRTGRTRRNLEASEKVAFSAVAMGRLLPADEALEFSVEYAGVVAFGVDYRPTTDDELRRTAVYRIDVESWSGKQKEAEADFPGAFDLTPVPVPFPRRGACPAIRGPRVGRVVQASGEERQTGRPRIDFRYPRSRSVK